MAGEPGRRCCGNDGIGNNQIRNELDIERHMDYLHYNPIRHGLVKQVKDWPYSSFHRCLEAGVYTPDWAMTSPVDEDGFGEWWEVLRVDHK